jgi:hypothetical protein
MNDTIQNNDQRIKYLLYKINNGTASLIERREYIDLLYNNGYINLTEYNKYKLDLNKPSPNFGEVLVGIGLAVLIGTLISEMFKGKK